MIPADKDRRAEGPLTMRIQNSEVLIAAWFTPFTPCSSRGYWPERAWELQTAIWMVSDGDQSGPLWGYPRFWVGYIPEHREVGMWGKCGVVMRLDAL